MPQMVVQITISLINEYYIIEESSQQSLNCVSLHIPQWIQLFQYPDGQLENLKHPSTRHIF